MPRTRQMVYTIRFMLAPRATRILPQHLQKARQFIRIDIRTKLLGKMHVQFMPRSTLDPTAGSVFMTIREWDIGLYVKNRRTAAQVSAENVDNRSIVFVGDMIELHARKSQRVGPKRAACGKHPDALLASQTGRPYSQRPAINASWPLLSLRAIACNVVRCSTWKAVFKLPDQPEMRKLVEPLNRGIDCKGFFENNPTLQMRCQKTIPRDAEFLGQVGIYVRNRFHGQHCNVPMNLPVSESDLIVLPTMAKSRLS